MIIDELKVGDSTAFNFLPPYDTLLSNKTIYTVASISTLMALVSKGLNPKENIYTVYGIVDNYDDDVKSNIHIVELTLGAKTFYVPIDLIVSKGIVTEIPYSERIIGIKLGFIPASEDLTTVLADLDIFIQAKLGIVASIGADEISAKVSIPDTTHTDREAVRDLLKTENGNYYTLYYNLKTVHQQLITKLQALETAYLNGAMIP